MKITIEEVKFDERGLVPAIVQDANTFQVLTLAYMNAESLKRTIDTKEAWFWSRSRSSLWHKGERSGHTQRVADILVDCDNDALTVLVVPNGPACHTGAQSCFHNELQEAVSTQEEIADRVGQYSVDLLRHRPVEAAQAGLDVANRDLELRSGQARAERGVHVPRNEYDVGLDLDQHLLEALHHARCLLRLRPGADPQHVVRSADRELLEEDL